MKTKPSAPLVYIGTQRRCRLERLAVEISFTSGCTISPATLVQFLIDEYSEPARTTMLAQLKAKGYASE